MTMSALARECAPVEDFAESAQTQCRGHARLSLYLPFTCNGALTSAALPLDNAKYQLEDYQQEADGGSVVSEIEAYRARGT
jgi:hypothetical protein